VEVRFLFLFTFYYILITLKNTAGKEVFQKGETQIKKPFFASFTHFMIDPNSQLPIVIPVKRFMENPQFLMMIDTDVSGRLCSDGKMLNTPDTSNSSKQKTGKSFGSTGSALSTPNLSLGSRGVLASPPPHLFPTIHGFGSRVKFFKSLQAPRRFDMLGSDGRRYQFLAKGGDDLRKDMRLMEFNHLVNGLLATSRRAGARSLAFRTFHVTPINRSTGVLEWVDNLQPMLGYVYFLEMYYIKIFYLILTGY
jgi:hypothetical protein